MKRSKAIELLAQGMLDHQESPENLLTYIEKTLDMHPLKYVSSGCMCGHFDVCSCGPGSYNTNWDRE